jgi:putative endonuclease
VSKDERASAGEGAVTRGTVASPGTATQVLGRYGEELAAQHLVGSGMSVLARNWRCRQGELDLVARDRDGTVVFVEVKTRAGTGFGQPAEAVGRVKARRLRVLACAWLLANPQPGGPELRFDVVSVVRRPGEQPKLTHLRGAF